MYGEIFNLYNRCFPDFQLEQGSFYELLELETAEIFRTCENERLTGFAIVRGNAIVLLCVDEAYRNKGLGSGLLQKSEDFIKSKGAEKIILGNAPRYIFQGVPDKDPRVVEFFKKRGYSAEWTSSNLHLELDDFDIYKLNIPEKPDTVSFRMAEENDRPALMRAVKYTDEKWVGIYENLDAPVMLAVQNDEIIGMQILDPVGARFPIKGKKTAQIGCVGIVPKARKQGIGMRMVVEGALWLKDRGCNSAELRYSALDDWYAKVGAYITDRQWMGEKNI